MIFLHGLLMNSLERTVSALRAGPLRFEGKCLKGMASNALLVVLLLFLANALTHQLPNAIADFIYRTR